MTDNFYEGELSPKTRRIILKHKHHEAQSSKWDYLHHKPPFEEQNHFVQCRLTDIEWQYDKDRFSSPLWAHYKTERYKTLVAMGMGIYSSRTPNKYRGSSPSNLFAARRARSNSLGERRGSLSPQKERKAMKQSFFEDSYRTPRKKSIGEHFSTLPDESSLKKNSIYKYNESPNGSPSKKKPPISPLKTTGRVVTYKSDRAHSHTMQKSKSGESEDFRNSMLQQHQVSISPQKSWNPVLSEQKNAKATSGRSSSRNELRETASFRAQDLREPTEPEEQDCPVPEPNVHTPIRESHETPNQSTRRSRKDRKKIKEEKSQTPSLTSDALDFQSEKEPTSVKNSTPIDILEVSPIQKNQLSNNQESKTKERRSRKERTKNESEVEGIEGWSVDMDVLSNSSGRW